jgi:hypothetical protein
LEDALQHIAATTAYALDDLHYFENKKCKQKMCERIIHDEQMEKIQNLIEVMAYHSNSRN